MVRGQWKRNQGEEKGMAGARMGSLFKHYKGLSPVSSWEKANYKLSRN